MSDRENQLDDAYQAMPAHLRELATKLFKEIAVTAEPSKSVLEATLIEFVGQLLFLVEAWKAEKQH